MNDAPSWLIIPAKSPAQAKSRLSTILGSSERCELAKTMLADVLSAAGNASRKARIAVVTKNRAMAEIARAHAAIVIDEENECGTNSAVESALRRTLSEDSASFMIVPTDLPHIEPGHIDLLWSMLDRSQMVLVPASRDGGTNILGCAPGTSVPVRYGPSSFTCHVQEANRSGIKPRIYPHARLGIDIDDPDDLKFFFDMNTPTRTQNLLRSIYPGRQKADDVQVASATRSLPTSGRVRGAIGSGIPQPERRKLPRLR